MGDEIIREMNVFFLIKLLHFSFEGQLSIPWDPLTCCVFQSHSNENRMDTKIKMEWFFFDSSQSVILLGLFKQKPFSLHWTVIKVPLSFELELNMMWCFKDGSLSGYPVSSATVKSPEEVHFSQQRCPSWTQIDGDHLGPPLGVTFILDCW